MQLARVAIRRRAVGISIPRYRFLFTRADFYTPRRLPYGERELVPDLNGGFLLQPLDAGPGADAASDCLEKPEFRAGGDPSSAHPVVDVSGREHHGCECLRGRGER